MEYPIVTRYKEPRVRYERIKQPIQKQKKYRKDIKWELIVFIMGTIVGFNYIEKTK